MLKKLLAIVCLICLFASFLPACAEGETYYAYFEDACWIRTQPKSNTPTVVYVPKRTLLRLTPVNDKYAATSYDGKEGYIYMKGGVKVNYTDPKSPEAKTVEGFFGAPARMRTQPIKNASYIGDLPTDVRFCVTYVTDTYAYLVYEGKEGYAYIADFVEMDYKKGSVQPYVAFSAKPVTAYDSPYCGALEVSQIAAYTPVTVTGYDGDHLVVNEGAQSVYVESTDLISLAADFEVEDFAAKMEKKADVYGHPLKNAAVTGAFSKNADVTVLSYQGDFARVTDGSLTGYVYYDSLKSSSNTKAAVKALQEYADAIEAKKYLNVALTMMEENNPITRMYNQNCGGMVQARFKYGVPYLFGGMHESSLLRARYASQNSNYYSTEKLYLGGFDCIGFARWLHNQAGMNTLPAISDIPKQNKKNLVSVKGKTFPEWSELMKVGDSIAIAYKGGGYHIMVYIGTLRDFGYTEGMLGDLAPYIDYPLAIHCGMNNYHTAWYTQYLTEVGYSSVTPPDGGVTISVIGAPYKKCPHTETMWKGTKNVKTFYWFDLEGYNLTSIDPTADGIRWYEVYRNTER